MVSTVHPFDLRERAFRFTCDTFDYCHALSGLLETKKLGDQSTRNRLVQEADELSAILATSVKRLQTDAGRP